MRTLLVSALLSLTSFAFAQSPIVLTATNMPSSGDTLRYTSVSINSIGNYTQTGVNMTWNFGAVTSTTEGIRSFKSSISTPYALFFASFTGFAEKMPDILIGGNFGFTDYYNFYKKQTTPLNAYVADGVGMTFSNIPLPCNYTDKDELYIFPLSYPKHDSTKYKFTTPNNALVPFRYTSVGYRITDVDGWGTITTPYGTESCLRLVSTQYGVDSIKNNIIPIPIGFPNITRSYQWLTANSKIPYFEVSGTVIGNNFVPTQARYRGFKPKESVNTGIANENRAANQIVVFPNPVIETLHLSAMPAGAELVIYDLNGKIVKRQTVSEATEDLQLNVSTLSKGIYSIRFSHLDESQELRFVKE